MLKKVGAGTKGNKSTLTIDLNISYPNGAFTSLFHLMFHSIFTNKQLD